MSSRRKRRVPQCARCRSHNTVASVRGHKRECQWKDCTCAKCLMVTEKRRITAVRVAILRRERKRRMSHTMDAFHIGLHGASPWGMMGQVPGTYTAEQFHGKYAGTTDLTIRLYSATQGEFRTDQYTGFLLRLTIDNPEDKCLLDCLWLDQYDNFYSNLLLTCFRQSKNGSWQ
jgi:hypothetical protein